MKLTPLALALLTVVIGGAYAVCLTVNLYRWLLEGRLDKYVEPQ